MLDTNINIEKNTVTTAFVTFLTSPHRGKLKDFEATSYSGNTSYTLSIFTGSIYSISDESGGILKVNYITPTNSSGVSDFFTKMTREELKKLIEE